MVATVHQLKVGITMFVILVSHFASFILWLRFFVNCVTLPYITFSQFTLMSSCPTTSFPQYVQAAASLGIFHSLHWLKSQVTNSSISKPHWCLSKLSPETPAELNSMYCSRQAGHLGAGEVSDLQQTGQHGVSLHAGGSGSDATGLVSERGSDESLIRTRWVNTEDMQRLGWWVCETFTVWWLNGREKLKKQQKTLVHWQCTRLITPPAGGCCTVSWVVLSFGLTSFETGDSMAASW